MLFRSKTCFPTGMLKSMLNASVLHRCFVAFHLQTMIFTKFSFCNRTTVKSCISDKFVKSSKFYRKPCILVIGGSQNQWNSIIPIDVFAPGLQKGDLDINIVKIHDFQN